MRFLLLSTAVLVANPALADRFQATARINDITVYPWGAAIQREVRLDLPQGTHEIVVSGIPQDLNPDSLRVTGKGATIGAANFLQGRITAGEPEEPAEFTVAEDDFRRLTAELARHDARIGEINARAGAASDMIDFMMRLAESQRAGDTDFTSLAGLASQQLQDARKAMADAKAEITALNQARQDLADQLARATERRDALRPADPPQGTLVITAQGQDAPAQIRISSTTANASWEPVYDFSLQRKQGTLRMDRGLRVSQQTGEDWRDVHLSLSTAQPMDQSKPAGLVPTFVEIHEQAKKLFDSSRTSGLETARMDDSYPTLAADAEAPVMGRPVMVFSGETVVYDYPNRINLRSGQDSLQLPLDSHDLTPKIVAEAVPRRDDTAYLVADTVNSTKAIILPGRATFYADGVLVGHDTLEMAAAGDDMKLGFGPLTGIRIERRLPDETNGERGLIVKSAERTETAILKISNLTAEEWPLRIIDQVPVSRQKDLRIDWSANPEPDQTDPDGKRGLLVWNTTIAPGQKRDITLTTTLRWPDGYDISGY